MILVQLFFALLLLGPILWGIRNWMKYRSIPTSKTKASYATMVNSAVFYALAFNIIFFLQEVFLVMGKKALGLKSFLYHNNHTWEGEHPMASLMQGSGALAIFFIGLTCLAIFQFMRTSKSFWKLFVLWLAFHGLVQSIPQVIVAYLDPGTDVGDALVGYLQLNPIILIFLAVTSTVAVALVCIWFSRPLLEYASDDIDLNNPKARLKYIRFIAVGAALIGCVLIVPFRVPPMTQAIAPFFVFAVSIPWVWAAAAVNRRFNRIQSSVNEKIYWSPIVLLVLLLIFFRVVLAPGVEF